MFFSVTCYNVTMLKQDCNNDFFELGQQKINFSFFELCLPDDDPVYTLKKVMEELDFSGLLTCYSDKGRVRKRSGFCLAWEYQLSSGRTSGHHRRPLRNIQYFFTGKGNGKPRLQQLYDELEDHEKRKPRAYKEDIGRYYNMAYKVFKDEHYYVCKEFMLYVIGRNIDKYHRFLHHEIEKFERKTDQKTA